MTPFRDGHSRGERAPPVLGEEPGSPRRSVRKSSLETDPASTTPSRKREVYCIVVSCCPLPQRERGGRELATTGCTPGRTCHGMQPSFLVCCALLMKGLFAPRTEG